METRIRSLKTLKRLSLGIEGKTNQKLAAIIFVQDLEKILKSQDFGDLRNIVFFVAYSERFQNRLLQRKAKELLRILNLN